MKHLTAVFTKWSNLNSREGGLSILDSRPLREKRGSTWLCAGLCRHRRRCVFRPVTPASLHLQLSAYCQYKERDLAFRVKSMIFQTPAPILARKPTARWMPISYGWATAFESSTGSHWKIPVSDTQHNILDLPEMKQHWLSSQIQASFIIMGWVYKNEIILYRIMEV